jgi:hypothetical protein
MHHQTDLYIYYQKTIVGGISIHDDLENTLDLFYSSTAYLEQPKTVKQLKDLVEWKIKWFKKQDKLFKYEQKLLSQCETLLLKLNCFKDKLIVSDFLHNKK